MASSSDRSAHPTARRGFQPPQNDAERLVMRRAEDLFGAAQKHWSARWSHFLSDREQLLCAAALGRCGCAWHCFEGGYPGAERRLLGILPPGEEQPPPIAFLQIDCRWDGGPANAPAHKDYLGALTGLSLQREALGDILLDDAAPGRAYLAALESAVPVIEQLCEVGHASAHVERCEAVALGAIANKPRALQTATVASLRLDAVLAAMLKVSRGTAAELIRGGRVEINHVPATAAHSEVYEDDLFTVRGYGRWRLQSLGGKSRKDRLFIQFFQY